MNDADCGQLLKLIETELGIFPCESRSRVDAIVSAVRLLRDRVGQAERLEDAIGSSFIWHDAECGTLTLHACEEIERVIGVFPTETAARKAASEAT